MFYHIDEGDCWEGTYVWNFEYFIGDELDDEVMDIWEFEAHVFQGTDYLVDELVFLLMFDLFLQFFQN